MGLKVALNIHMIWSKHNGITTSVLQRMSWKSSNGKKIKYRPFVVKEEKLLLIALETEDEKEIERAVKQLLKGCIQSRVKIEELPIFDLEYIFLQIRAVSVGEDIELMVTCRDDEKTQVKYHLNLSTVQVTKPKT